MWVKVIMNYFYNIRKKILSDVIVCIALTMVFALLMVSMSYNMQPFKGNEQAMKLAKAFAQEQPNINATNLYDSGQMVLGNNVKHLAILIPNEGHHGPGEEDESRFIAQPFVPQNVVISPGTEVVWFNGDRVMSIILLLQVLLIHLTFKQDQLLRQ
jgi:hypothetical protein